MTKSLKRQQQFVSADCRCGAEFYSEGTWKEHRRVYPNYECASPSLPPTGDKRYCTKHGLNHGKKYLSCPISGDKEEEAQWTVPFPDAKIGTLEWNFNTIEQSAKQAWEKGNAGNWDISLELRLIRISFKYISQLLAKERESILKEANSRNVYVCGNCGGLHKIKKYICLKKGSNE